MRPDRPSNTAVWVALWRGFGSLERDPVVRDPLARDLLPMPYKALLAAAEHVPRAVGAAMRGVHAITRGHTRHLPLRTRAIDEAIAEAVHTPERSEPARGGARQLVILGAGLDARAWRLDALEDVRVFEVDHPATQAYKRERIGGRRPRAREVVFVGVDFERQDLAQRLAESGHDADAPTVYVWEGVTMYLTRPAIEATLRSIVAASRRGATLILTYQTAVGYRALGLVVRMAREPFTSYFSRDAMRSLLAAHGFEVVSDTSDPEWTALYTTAEPDDWAVERVVTATLR